MPDDEVDPIWDPTADPQWSARVLASCGGWKSEPLRMVLQGDCPRCAHPGAIDAWLPQEAVSPAGLARGGPKKEQYVECACRYTHKKTPKEEHGCGARGRVDVAP